MPRETNQRVPAGLQAAETISKPQATQVVANQNVVAERNSLQKVGDALAGFLPAAQRWTAKQEAETSKIEEGRKKADYLAYISQTKIKGEELAHEWRNDPDAKEKLTNYYNEMIGQLPDEEFQNAVRPHLLQEQGAAVSKQQAVELQQQEVADKAKLADILGLGILDGSNDSQGIESWIRMGVEDFGFSRREMGAILAQVYITKSDELADPELLKQLDTIRIDDVPLRTVYNDALITAERKAKAAQASKFNVERVQSLTEFENMFSDPNVSTQTALRKYQEYIDSTGNELFSNEQISNFIQKRGDALGDFAALENAKQAFRGGYGFMFEGNKQLYGKALEASLQEAASSGDPFANTLVVASKNNAVVPAWKSVLNNVPLTLDNWDGTMPENFQSGYELYRRLLGNPAVLNNHLTDKHAADFMNAYHFAKEGKQMSDEDAYAEAFHLSNDKYVSDQYRQSPRWQDVQQATNDLVGRTFGKDMPYYNDVYASIMRLSHNYGLLGASPAEASERAMETFQATHINLNGVWEPKVAGMPDELYQHANARAIEEYKTWRKDTLVDGDFEVDVEEAIIRPVPGNATLWQVWSDPYHPTGYKFDMGKYQGDYVGKKVQDRKDTITATAEGINRNQKVSREKVLQTHRRQQRITKMRTGKDIPDLTEEEIAQQLSSTPLAQQAIQSFEPYVDFADWAWGEYNNYWNSVLLPSKSDDKPNIKGGRNNPKGK